MYLTTSVRIRTLATLSSISLHLIKILQNVPSSFDRTLEARRVNNIKLEVLFLQFRGGTVRFGNTSGSKRDINPASKSVLNIPLAFSVSNKNNCIDLQQEKIDCKQ